MYAWKYEATPVWGKNTGALNNFTGKLVHGYQFQFPCLHRIKNSASCDHNEAPSFVRMGGGTINIYQLYFTLPEVGLPYRPQCSATSFAFSFFLKVIWVEPIWGVDDHYRTLSGNTLPTGSVTQVQIPVPMYRGGAGEVVRASDPALNAVAEYGDAVAFAASCDSNAWFALLARTSCKLKKINRLHKRRRNFQEEFDEC